MFVAASPLQFMDGAATRSPLLGMYIVVCRLLCMRWLVQQGDFFSWGCSPSGRRRRRRRRRRKKTLAKEREREREIFII